VLGIYIGWRGDSLTTPGLKFSTIGNRADAADRLAANRDHDGMYSLYSSLKDIANALHGADPDGRMLVVGHSLGGRIVTRLFMNDIAMGEVRPLGNGSTRPN
jgi:pimeloyl-ACP methyl ester carboxylesterase